MVVNCNYDKFSSCVQNRFFCSSECVTIITGIRQSVSVVSTSWEVLISNAFKASSRRRTFGLNASAIASCTLCDWPPLSADHG
mmetsp:Transcript_62424/g.151959  ORF Transcript_62424/g.151959 Transcript_62424/m.151959 type:complete len:83 (+) Transcript_62424:1990-2238(+)